MIINAVEGFFLDLIFSTDIVSLLKPWKINQLNHFFRSIGFGAMPQVIRSLYYIVHDSKPFTKWMPYVYINTTETNKYPARKSVERDRRPNLFNRRIENLAPAHTSTPICFPITPPLHPTPLTHAQVTKKKPQLFDYVSYNEII